MLSRQEEEQERRKTLENDLKVLEQRRGSTFHQYAQSQADEINQGRFAAIGSPRVVGSQPNVSSQYPAAAAHQRDPVGVEPPLGIDINAMPTDDPSAVSVSFPATEATGAPATDSAPSSELVPPLADDVEPGAGAPSFSANDNTGSNK